MRKSLIQFLLMAVLSAYTAVAWSQTTVRGQLVDAETGEPLVGAAVMVEGTTQGSVTDIRSEERRVGKECRSRWSPYH